MINLKVIARTLVLLAAIPMLAACASDADIILGEVGDHKVNVFGALSDEKELSQKVRAALRQNGQTTVTNIDVSQESVDTVKLTGYVNNDAVSYEAEQVAYGVEGVRFVINNLYIR